MPDYSVVEEFLFNGFITSRVHIGSTPLVLKSLNQNEFALLDQQVDEDKSGWKIYASYYLAYSTFFLNRVNVLPERPGIIHHIAETYSNLSPEVVISLLSCANRLNEKGQKTLPDVKRYSCGPESRQTWTMYKNTNLCDSRSTGIEGTEKLGLNIHQRLWSYFNTMEDQENEYMRQYGMAKFIASSNSPKQVSKINARDKQKRKKEEQKKQALYEKTSPAVQEEFGQIRVCDESASELLDQMERSVEGKKDFHDLVVEQHQKDVRDRYMRERKKMEQGSSAGPTGISSDHDEIKGLDPDDLDKIIEKQNQQKESQENSVEMGSPDKAFEQKEEQLLKWGFIDKEDIPEHRRKHYEDKMTRTGSQISEGNDDDRDGENPLIKDHYKRVQDDLQD